MNAVAWTDQCRTCANLRPGNSGRIWKCKAVRMSPTGFARTLFLGPMVYAADARAESGKCGPDAKLHVPMPATKAAA